MHGLSPSSIFPSIFENFFSDFSFAIFGERLTGLFLSLQSTPLGWTHHFLLIVHDNFNWKFKDPAEYLK